MRELEHEALHAARARGKIAGELDQQPLRGEEQGLGLRDFGEQFDSRAEPGGRREKSARIGKPPAGAVEVVEQPLAEAPRQAVARQREQIAERGGADRLQGFERVGVAAQDGRGQRRNGFVDPRRLGDQGFLAGVSEPGGGAGGRRHGQAGGEAHRSQSFAKVAENRGQAAEQLQAARDFEQHRIGKLQRDVRRELHRPRRDPEQRLGLGGGIARSNAQLRSEREPRRRGHARAHPARARLAVAGDDAVVLGHGPGLGRGRAAQQRFERQFRQMKGDPQHGGNKVVQILYFYTVFGQLASFVDRHAEKRQRLPEITGKSGARA